jgi:LmbE family N-acetylglucosaminyl deacetylase
MITHIPSRESRVQPKSNPLPALLAVFAHPDDESFRPGGTLALLARRGVTVHLLTATHGEAGACGDPPVCRPEELPALRERELRCACAALNVKSLCILGYRDGHLGEVDPEQLTAHILEVVRAVHPQVMLSFGPDGLSGHPDHIVTGRCAAEAFRRAEEVAALYTVAVPDSLARRLGMQRVRSVPDTSIALAVDISPAWETKLAAIRCHATQISSSPMMRAPAEKQRLFFGTEYFVRTAQRRAEGDFLKDIFKP